MNTFRSLASLRRGLTGALAGLGIFVMVASAQAAIVNWTAEGPVTDVVSSSFNTGEILFDPFLASSLDSITGNGFFHQHFLNSTLISMDLRLDGVFTNIFATTLTDTASRLLSTNIPVPIDFGLALLDGIRFTAVPIVNQAYHAFDSTLNFQFNTVTPLPTAAVIPIPAALPLFLTGLAGLGLMRRRRRRA